MPLFHRKTDEEKQHEEDEKRHRAIEQQEQQASLEALGRGGLPIQATRRLQDVMEHPKLFTSDLSVNEFLLVKEAGFQPITQVAGSSIYHVGFQTTPRGGIFSMYSSGELSTISMAMNHARQLALGRLEHEAKLVGADAVVGVRVNRANYDWGNDLLEFNMIGTAVRLEGQPPSDEPALTNLSGQEFWSLFRAGYVPTGIVGGSTVYYVVASWQTQMANNSFYGSRYNQELVDFSAGLYSARHLAMRHVHEQASRVRSTGIVGMQIQQEEREHEVELGNDQRRTDMVFTFHVLGTAIAALPGDHPVPKPQAIVPL